LRVSTDGQTVENQRQALQEAAVARGWTVLQTYEDKGISGAKGRELRPGLDAMLKGAVKRQFDICMAWSVDRLGRSLPDLVTTMQELHGAKVDIFLHQQSLDTTTPSGRAMFQMLGVFSEFERSMIVARVNVGMRRAQAEQAYGIVRRDKDGRLKKAIGRPVTKPDVEARIRARLATGVGMLKIAAEFGVGSGTVQRIKREMMTMSEVAD
jgi:DNA invertase Pin-like site-specific DNA recombinase